MKVSCGIIVLIRDLLLGTALHMRLDDLSLFHYLHRVYVSVYIVASDLRLILSLRSRNKSHINLTRYCERSRSALSLNPRPKRTHRNRLWNV